jgi:DNA invertase Pin-like site-specific DNA recombinase
MTRSAGSGTRRSARVRCAIYTRKSSEEGLEQEFNSLLAKREACEAFITSQRHEGWVCLSAGYDDGGFSGATLERPALQRLLADITAGRVDIVVVYKIDRLTRSLADFAKIVEILDARRASFVSVTQQFNTTTSMGRLTLNVLLSFAQFEREVIGERIRDKIAASKKKGMWMGGVPPLGYRAQDRKLVIVDSEAELVRSIFRRYAELGSVRLLKEELEAQGRKSKSWTSAAGRLIGGKSFSRGALYLMLRNCIYRGEILHKGQSHPGEHTPIIDQPLWDAVQMRLASNTAERTSGTRISQPSLLAGMLFDREGSRMTPSYAVKKGTRYRYYVSRPLITKDQTDRSTGLRIPAAEIEQLVNSRVRQWLLEPGGIYKTIQLPDLREQRRLVARASEIGNSWTELSGTRQRALLTTMIERIDIGADQIDIHFRPTRLVALLDVTTPLPSAIDDKTQILSGPIRLRRAGREITMRIDSTDPFATAKPDARLIKLLIRARRFNATLLGSDRVPFAYWPSARG